MRVFELLEKDIYFFSKRKKKAVRILCKFFPYNSVFVKVKFNQSNCSILEISAPHVTTYISGHPVYHPSMANRPTPRLLRYRYADKTALLKGWRANRALARLFLETRASSKSLGRARNADVADRANRGPPDKTFASLTGVGIRARGGCRWWYHLLFVSLDESRQPSWREFWW